MTAIPLDEGAGGVGSPVLKRRRIGEQFVGMLAHIERRDHRDIAGNVVLKPDGKPRSEEVLTFVTLPGSSITAGIGKDDPGHVVEAGEVVRYIVTGGAYAAWIDAKKELRRGPVVGDVMTLVHDHADVYPGPGQKPVARYTTQDQVDAHRINQRQGAVSIAGPIALRAALDGESGTWLNDAINAHHAAKGRKAAAPVPAYGADYGDDAPF